MSTHWQLVRQFCFFWNHRTSGINVPATRKREYRSYVIMHIEQKKMLAEDEIPMQINFQGVSPKQTKQTNKQTNKQTVTHLPEEHEVQAAQRTR